MLAAGYVMPNFEPGKEAPVEIIILDDGRKVMIGGLEMDEEQRELMRLVVKQIDRSK
jgi:hypothetical protein